MIGIIQLNARNASIAVLTATASVLRTTRRLAIKPVLDIVEPLINLAMETIAPKLKAALDTCKDDMAILEPLVKASLC